MKFIANLKVIHRFALIGAIALIAIAIPVAVSVSRVVDTMQVAQRESDGIPAVRATLQAIQLVQQHRGLSAMILEGSPNAQSERAAVQQEVTRTLDGLSALTVHSRDPATRAALTKAQDDWRKVREKATAPGWAPADSFAQHTDLIEQILLVSDLLTDDFGLSLDPEVDTYQLVQYSMVLLPPYIEELGKVRAIGASALTRSKRTDDDYRNLLVGLSHVAEEQKTMDRAFQKSAAASPQIRTRLEGLIKEAAVATGAAEKLAREKLLEAAQPNLPPAEYFAALTKAINTQIKVADSAMVTLDSLLTARVAGLRQTLTGLGIAVLLLLGLGAWVSVVAARSIIRQIGGEPAELVTVANAIAQGDLTAHIQVQPGDTRSIAAAMGEMKHYLSGVVNGVRGNADSVATASTQIAQGNQDLSQRTEEQASALQQTAASMEQLGTTVKQTADNAVRANKLAQDAAGIAQQGGSVVAQVVARMQGINDSSRKIADIISVIDGIAFQTNILALNAAVEAARAGEQGRGFAVVASEVRTLAGRSAEAAKEIKNLITNSVDQVEQGSTLVARAGQTMEEIVTAIQRVSDIVGEISAASVEQSSGVDQIGQAVSQMDQVTQQNAALVEESAAAAEGLKKQAEGLVQAVALFKIEYTGGYESRALAANSPMAAPARAIAAPPKRVLAMPNLPTGPRSAEPIRSPQNLAPAAQRTGTDDWESF
jgi:methyl-accepting chemotaxis protein